MIDEHTLATIKAEAENWRLDGPGKGTRREAAVYCTWDREDSTKVESAVAYLREATDEASVTTTVRFAAEPVIVARTIRARFASPFAEAK